MGLIIDKEKGKEIILSEYIYGFEDHIGINGFEGSCKKKTWFTACKMSIKI